MNNNSYNFTCATCIFLNRDRKEISEDNQNCYRYGCNATGRDGFICAWVSNGEGDKGLKWMGCSHYNVIHQGQIIKVSSMFDDLRMHYLYVGKLNKNKRLLHCIETHEYKVISSDWFRSQTGVIKSNISIAEQSEKEYKVSKYKARKRKELYIERQNSNRH